MKNFTNYAAGPRGINVKGKGTVWLDPGASVDLDPKEIVGAVPDMGKEPDAPAAAAADADAFAAVQSENEELKKQVESLTKQLADATKK